MNIRREDKTSLRFNAGVFLILAVFIFFNAASDAKADLADHLLINEIQTDSVAGAGGSTDDFVELYNPTDQGIVLDAWSLQKQSSASTSAIYKTNLNGVIAAGGYFLLVRGDVSTAQELKDMADILMASNFSISSGNTIYLVNDNINIENQADVNIVDYVGMGVAESFEGVASADNPGETKSISRVPDGEDSDENSVDFFVLDTPSPQSTGTEQNESDLGGRVLITITGAEPVVQNIGSNTSDIVFAVNGEGIARVYYGLDTNYGGASIDVATMANTETKISLDGLLCDTTYHYSIYAENEDGSDSYGVADASFATLPCGIRIDDISMTRSSARANNSYLDGWSWNFDITVWDMNEASLKMKFEEWSGLASLDAGANMQFSVDGIDWINISGNDTYSLSGADISAIDEDLNEAGRQLSIQVQMKVPVGTLSGFYNSNYGILTE